MSELTAFAALAIAGIYVFKCFATHHHLVNPVIAIMLLTLVFTLG